MKQTEEKNGAMNAYYKNKPYKIFAYTMEDLRKLKDAPDVPLIVTLENNITEEKYENEKEIVWIESLLPRYEKLLSKKQTPKITEELRKIEDSIRELYNAITNHDADLSNINLFKEEIEGLKSKIMYKADTLPIDLSGRTESIFIKGRGHSISDITILKEKGKNETALFINVDCDITFTDINFKNLKICGRDNVASLLAGNGKEGNAPVIQLFDTNVEAEVYGLNNVAELLVNFDKATLEGRNFSYNVKINSIEKTGSVTNKFKLRVPVKSYFYAGDYTGEENSPVITYTRKPKKND